MRRVAFVLCAGVAVASADPATEARVFYARGRAAASRGRHAEALRAFLQSRATAHNPNTLAAIAQLYDALGQTEAAFASYAELEASATDASMKESARQALRRLSRDVAALAVETDPPAAEVYLSHDPGARVCRTPCRIAVAHGPRRLTVRLEGWRPAEAGVEARRGVEVPVRVRLERVTGEVRIASRPQGAPFRIVGPVGDDGHTPADLRLPPGRYVVEVGGDGFATSRREVSVDADRTTEIDVALAPPPAPRARLLLTTGSRGAHVSVDGKRAGFSPLVIDVEPGAHRIRVAADGADWEGSVSFTPSEQVRVFAPLAARRSTRLRGPLVAVAAGLAAGAAGTWLLWKEDRAVPGAVALAASGAAFAVTIGLVLGTTGEPAVARIEREPAAVVPEP